MTHRDENVDVLYDEETLAARIRELGARITQDYVGRDLVLIGVLKGCILFLADLCRSIEVPHSVDFLGLSSYHGGTESSGVVRITSDLNRPIAGKHVLVVEDIIDTGLTMQYLLENLGTRQPASLAICSLLFKPETNRIPVKIDYLGFEIPNHFVVGYGLDYDELYRNLPYLGVWKGPLNGEKT